MGQEIDRLVTVYDANWQRMEDKLNKMMRANYGAASRIEKSWAKSGNVIQASFGRALDRVHGQASALPGPLGAVGGSLGRLGVAGAAAAVAIVGVAAALSQARKAVAFADEIADTAARLNITTDALQQYRYAVRLTGGDQAQAASALENFSEVLGRAKEGLTRALIPFKALGFTAAQVKGFKDTDEALTVVLDRLHRLGDKSLQDAIIGQFGLGGLKTVIQAGTVEMERLFQEAKNLGIVMDAELIRRGSKFNDELETMHQIVDVQLKSAFIDLAPVLLGLLRMLAGMARLAADIADAFRQTEDQTTRSLERKLAKLKEERAQIANGVLPQEVNPEGALYAEGGGWVSDQGTRLKRMDAAIKVVEDELARRAALETPFKPNPDAPGLPDLGSGGAARASERDPIADLIKRVTEEQLRNDRAFADQKAQLDDDIIEAETGYFRTASELGAFAQQALDREEARANLEIDRQVADGELSAVEGRLLKEKVAQLYAARSATLADQTHDAIQREQLDNERAIADAQIALLSIQEGMATTAAERRRIQLRILETEYRIQRKLLEAELNLNPELTPEQRAQRLGVFDKTYAARVGQAEANTRGPLASYFDSMPQTAEEMKEALQGVEVDGLRSLGDELEKVALGVESLGEAFRNMANQVIADLARIAIQKYITGPLGNFLFGDGEGDGGFVGGLFGGHRAGGGPVSAGKAYMVGERGQEMFVPSSAGTIVPADLTRRLMPGWSGGAGERRSLALTFAPAITLMSGGAGDLAALRAEMRARQREFLQDVLARVPGYLSDHRTQVG